MHCTTDNQSGSILLCIRCQAAAVKAACRHVCGGDITIAHTASDISEFSVTSFYTAGLDLGLVSSDDFCPYGAQDHLDFDALEKIRYGT